MTDLHTELRRCPFCGGEADAFGRDELVTIECSHCTYSLNASDVGDVIAAWNTRTSPELDTLRAQNAELVEALEAGAEALRYVKRGPLDSRVEELISRDLAKIETALAKARGEGK